MNINDTRLKGAAGYVIAIGLTVFLSSCASTKPPTGHMAESQVAIKQAEQMGARSYAPLEIRQARKKLEQAEAFIEDEKYEKARRLADEAKVDAELAGAKSLSAKAQKAVKELRESIRVLKEEIELNQKGQ